MVVKLTGARPRYFLWKNIVSMYFSQYNPHTDKHHNCYVSCSMVLLYDTAVIVDLCTRFFPINLKCSSSHLFSGRWAQPERCRIKHTNSNHLKEKQHWKQNQTLILSDVLKQEPHTLWEERGHTHFDTHLPSLHINFNPILRNQSWSFRTDITSSRPDVSRGRGRGRSHEWMIFEGNTLFSLKQMQAITLVLLQWLHHNTHTWNDP